MEKLIELLNEYTGRERVLDSDMGEDWFFLKGNCLQQIREVKLISRKFGFIKWLVESDKIDGPKIREKNPYIIDTLNDYTDLYSYEKLLMLLSISNSPIEDLVSILK